MESALEWREQALTRDHDRGAFDCGSPPLNEYLQRYARRNHESGGAKTFAAVALETSTVVLGYYSISPGAIESAKTPQAITRRLRRYEVPVFRLGRPAVALSVQGWVSAVTCYWPQANARLPWRKTPAESLAIDAKDEKAAGWYERYGTLRLLHDPLKLGLPLETILRAIRR